MTEFDLALEFLQTYVRAAVAAAEAGESLDERREFAEFCDGFGIETTEERRDLVRDFAGVIKECLAGADTEEFEASHVIPNAALFAGLERYGWRLAFLNRDVRD